MRNLYLVDYENVGISGILTLNKNELKNSDNIVIFIRTDETLNKDIFKILNDYKCNFYIMKTNINRKNSVDFLITSYLIDNINLYKKSYIISNDKGYETVKEYIENYKDRDVILKNVKENKKIIEVEKQEIIIYLHNNYPNLVSEVVEIIKKENKTKNDSKRKNYIHNDLVKKFPEHGRIIYANIKDFL